MAEVGEVARRLSERIRQGDAGSARLAGQAHAKAKQAWGSAWSKLSPEMQQGAISLAAIQLLAAQDESIEKYRAGVEFADAVMKLFPG